MSMAKVMSTASLDKGWCLRCVLDLDMSAQTPFYPHDIYPHDIYPHDNTLSIYPHIYPMTP